MYDCGQFPGLKLTGAGRDRNSVAGELSRAQSGDIDRLDRFEGAVGNNPLYRRRRVELSTPSRTAWVYGYARPSTTPRSSSRVTGATTPGSGTQAANSSIRSPTYAGRSAWRKWPAPSTISVCWRAV
jgi:hypothetical protein